MTRKLAISLNWQEKFDLKGLVERAKIADAARIHSIWVAETWGHDAFTTLRLLECADPVASGLQMDLAKLGTDEARQASAPLVEPCSPSMAWNRARANRKVLRATSTIGPLELCRESAG